MIRVVESSANRRQESSGEAFGQDRGGAADLHDAAARWRTPAADADAARSDPGNVVLFARARRDGAATAPELSVAARPTIGVAQPHRALRWAALLTASVAAHVALYLPFAREPPPMASLGEIAVSVELVLGANQDAGLTPDKGASEVSNPAPAQAPDAIAAQPAEPPTTEVAKVEPVPDKPETQVETTQVETPPVETETPPEVAEKTEPAEKPPEQVAALPTEPSPPQPLAPVEATPEPAAPAQVQAAPLVTAAPAAELQAAVNPETPVATVPPRAAVKPPPTPAKPQVKPAPKKPETKPPVVREKRQPETRRATVRGERNDSRTTSPASTAAGGAGRGRSEANSNYAGLVQAHLRRYLRFPEEARSRGNGGSAAVAFALDGGGRVTSVRLLRGAGNATLDREATAVVRRASPFPAPPGGRGQSFTVPVAFRLQ